MIFFANRFLFKHEYVQVCIICDENEKCRND